MLGETKCWAETQETHGVKEKVREAKSAPVEDFSFPVCMLGAQQASILKGRDEVEGRLAWWRADQMDLQVLVIFL